MAKAIDVRNELERAPLGAGHWTLVAVLGFVTLFDGYDVFIAGSVIPFVMKAWGLRPSQAGFLVSSGLVGFMIGSLVGGPIADRIGRKPTLLGGLLLAGLLNLGTAAFVRSYEAFLIFRLCTGIGLGMLLPLAVTLINETAPKRSTNLLVGCVMIGWSAGGILAAVSGATLGQAFGWPAMFWAAGVGVPLALLCWLVLRESPRFLALRDRQDEALTVMRWLVPSAGYGAVRFTTPGQSRARGSIAKLLEPNVRRSTLVVWLCAACSLFAIYGLSSWLPQTMIQRGETFAASFAFGALLQFMAVLGGVGCGFAADRLDRRGVLAASWLLGGGAIAGLGLLNLHWSNIVFVSVAGFFIMGAQPVLNNFVASLYPTEVRSTGVGVELGVGRLGGILGPFIGGWLQQLYGGTGAMFLSMGAVLAVSALSLTALNRAPTPAPNPQGAVS